MAVATALTFEVRSHDRKPLFAPGDRVYSIASIRDEELVTGVVVEVMPRRQRPRKSKGEAVTLGKIIYYNYLVLWDHGFDEELVSSSEIERDGFCPPGKHLSGCTKFRDHS